MRKILEIEVCNEKPNAAAFGAFNKIVAQNAAFNTLSGIRSQLDGVPSGSYKSNVGNAIIKRLEAKEKRKAKEKSKSYADSVRAYFNS